MSAAIVRRGRKRGHFLSADLVLVAIGYRRTRFHDGFAPSDSALRLTDRGTVETGPDYVLYDLAWAACSPQAICARRGQSLIVWAIAEGREAAQGVDTYLMGESRLPLTAYK